MLAAGTTLGPYRILAPLGAGGMGEVYRARDTRLGRDVAIKVIHAAVARDPDRIKRFEQEARAAGALSHPNVCAIYDIGTHEGSPFVVMELLEGESLREKLRAGPLPIRKSIDYAAQAAHGLAAAHEKGIIHRDLKPENLFVTNDGWVKLLDFGLAKLTRPDALALSGEPTTSIAATETGAILGTVGYMSPEQVRGDAADARSDIFALGAVLYELLAGKRAFAGASYAEKLSAILKDEPSPLAASGQEIPSGLEAVVRRCLEKRPAERFQSARDLAFALESMGSGQDQLQGAAAAAAAPRHRRRLAWAVAAATIVLVGVGSWWAWEPVSRWLGGQHAAQAIKKEWILVAEFEGPPDDPELPRAAQSLISAALDQSGIVMTVPRDQLSLALEQAGRPETTRVDGKLARELAYRNSIRAVLEGRVNRVGSGYAAALRLSDSSNDSMLITVSSTARGEDELIPALDKLARRMRRALGENPAAVRATRGLYVFITPSFEAYRKLEQSSNLWNETGDLAGSHRIALEVLELDPDCAAAYAGMGAEFDMMGEPDSAVWAYDEALKRPGRLTEEQRLGAEASRAFARGDLEGGLQGLNRQLRLFPIGPGAVEAYNLRSVIHTWYRNFPEALADARRSSEASPFQPSQIVLAERARAEVEAGQLDQAEKTLSQLQGIWWHTRAITLAIARDDWAKAESLCAKPEADIAGHPAVRNTAILVDLVIHARRGEVRAARDCVAREVAAQGPRDGAVTLRSALWLAEISGTTVPTLNATLTADTTLPTAITRGWQAALAGNLTGARRELAALQRRSRNDQLRAGAAQDFLEASIAAAEKRWSDVVRHLGAIALRGNDQGWPSWGRIGAVQERWLVAEAWDQMGRPDSAAVAFERVLEPPIGYGGFAPYAHQRLVMIYARMGRREDAERHWQAFSAVFTNPDPEVRHLLDDARAAIQGLRGMAQPEQVVCRGSRPGVRGAALFMFPDPNYRWPSNRILASPRPRQPRNSLKTARTSLGGARHRVRNESMMGSQS
jgi:tetratricopeptide (TPR) repeat protein